MEVPVYVVDFRGAGHVLFQENSRIQNKTKTIILKCRKWIENLKCSGLLFDQRYNQVFPIEYSVTKSC